MKTPKYKIGDVFKSSNGIFVITDVIRYSIYYREYLYSCGNISNRSRLDLDFECYGGYESDITILYEKIEI